MQFGSLIIIFQRIQIVLGINIEILGKWILSLIRIYYIIPNNWKSYPKEIWRIADAVPKPLITHSLTVSLCDAIFSCLSSHINIFKLSSCSNFEFKIIFKGFSAKCSLNDRLETSGNLLPHCPESLSIGSCLTDVVVRGRCSGTLIMRLNSLLLCLYYVPNQWSNYVLVCLKYFMCFLRGWSLIISYVSLYLGLNKTYAERLTVQKKILLRSITTRELFRIIC